MMLKILLLRFLSSLGFSHARNALAERYEYGKDVQQDIDKALSLYRASANAGNLWAQNKLGGIYMDGSVGINVDYTEAIKWYRKAAGHGYLPSIYNLGRAHYYGYGVQQNFNEAKRLYEECIEAPYAKYNLGLMYADGIGVDVNLNKALVLLRTACGQGVVEAKCALVNVEKRIGVVSSNGVSDKKQEESKTNIVSRYTGLMGFPLVFSSLFIAAVFSASALGYVFSFIAGCIVYAILYAVLHKFFMSDVPQQKIKFYFLLMSLQMVPIAVITIYMMFQPA